MHAPLRSSIAWFVVLFVSACGGATPPATSDSPASAPPAQATPSQLTAAQCEAAGGQAVGDIGDGAIHRPDYVCPTSGKAPLGSVVPEPGGPVAIEGSVCCR